VVDDHEAVRTSFAQILETEGFEVLQAVDGLAALSVLKDTSVSAMVLDVAMPVLDGFGLLDKLDDPPPVIMVTARIYDVEVAKRRDKIFGFVSKPVPPDELISLVKRAVLAGGFRS
jgi:DNA-binding response OmpR family regulator